MRISLSSRLSVWQWAYSLGRRAINSVSQTFLRNSVSVSLFSSQGCRMNFLAILSSSLNTQIHVNYCVIFETDVQLFNLFKVKCYVFTFTIQLLVHDYSIGVLKSSTMEIWSGFFLNLYISLFYKSKQKKERRFFIDLWSLAFSCILWPPGNVCV